jgi:hypothetical protein
MTNAPSTPLNDTIIIALAQLIDDAQSIRRDPSHDDLRHQIVRAGLGEGDPNGQGHALGKAKRLRAVLGWALEYDERAGQMFVQNLLAMLRGYGAFREASSNYVGKDAIENAISAFASEGYELSGVGDLRPKLLDNLSGAALTDALNAYVRRANRGAEDAALVTGTGKDLLEAVAAHIVQERDGGYSPGWNFEMLLGRAYIALGLTTAQHPVQPAEGPITKMERAFFDLARSINTLRNKQGTGHGRPWLPTVTAAEAKIAIEGMGTIAEYLLLRHRERK